MQNKKFRLSVLLFIIFLITVIPLVSCRRNTAPIDNDSTENASDHTVKITDTSNTQSVNALLSEGKDMGQSYIDSLIFIGESTTFHLKSRGVLSGGRNTKQVWSPKSGTMKLDLEIDNVKIVYPETDQEMTFYEAASKKKPSCVIITFGLNGAPQIIKKGEEYFTVCYKKLTDSILRASPNTKIILQSAFPVAKNMDMTYYSVDTDTLNKYIDTLNSWAHSFAKKEGFFYLNTAEILKNTDNHLKNEYQNGDGYHLTTKAYEDIIFYIRTHPYS